jgi:hypothetical protein
METAGGLRAVSDEKYDLARRPVTLWPLTWSALGQL